MARFDPYYYVPIELVSSQSNHLRGTVPYHIQDNVALGESENWSPLHTLSAHSTSHSMINRNLSHKREFQMNLSIGDKKLKEEITGRRVEFTEDVCLLGKIQLVMVLSLQ